MPRISILAAAAALMASPAAASDWNFNLRTTGSEPVTSCAQIEVTSRDGRIARAEETTPVGAASSGVTVKGAKNGGIYASGGAAGYQVTLCKFAVAGSADAAQATLSRVTLNVTGGRVEVNGPAGGDWTAHLIVLAPDQGQLELETANGPLSVRGMTGRVTARATNGPIAIRQVSGSLDIQARNGPVDLRETSGEVRAVAHNGPLSVDLSGPTWNGAGLEARTENGPLSLRVPDDYQAGVRVDVSRHSPLSCRAAMCRDAVRLGDDSGGTLTIGSEQAQVRLSSRNGPVTIRSARQ